MNEPKHTCTKEDPWKEEYGFPVAHPDCYEDGDQENGWPGGDIVRMRFPNCGVTWKQELPQ